MNEQLEDLNEAPEPVEPPAPEPMFSTEDDRPPEPEKPTRYLGLNDHQLRESVILPILTHLDNSKSPGRPGRLNTEAAIALVLNTAKQESNLRYLRQLGQGPALGLWQMEPATHNDIWENFLQYNEDLAIAVRGLAIGTKVIPDPQQMIGNLFYACAMCRIHYYRQPDPLPPADRLELQAAYWKQHYNTHLGKGTVEEFMESAELLA